MKVSEFEAKLGTVSDAKLRQLFSASRDQGPEVAVRLILAEARRRGLKGMEGLEAVPDRDEVRTEAAAGAAMATMAYPREGAGAFGSDAPADAAGPALSEEAAPTDASVPALAPEWLTEETKSGMPLALKAILLLAAIGGVLAVAWKLIR